MESDKNIDSSEGIAPKKRPGRPKKKKNPVGRPKGQEAVMKDYRMRMLNSPKSRKVLASVFEVAMDPEHKHWPAASKMVMDRIAPSSGFSPDSKDGSKIQINISTFSPDAKPVDGEVIDG